MVDCEERLHPPLSPNIRSVRISGGGPCPLSPNIRYVRISGGGLRGAIARDAHPRALPRLLPDIRYVRLIYDLFVA